MFRFGVHRSNWRAYKACPEIRNHIRKQYAWGFIQKLLCVVVIPLLVVPVSITIVGELLRTPTERLVVGTLGLASQKKRHWKTEAYEVLSLEEIQERTGRRKSSA